MTANYRAHTIVNYRAHVELKPWKIVVASGCPACRPQYLIVTKQLIPPLYNSYIRNDVKPSQLVRAQDCYPEVVGLIPAKTQKTENSNLHGFEAHRPSSKGTKLLLQVIKAIINQAWISSVGHRKYVKGGCWHHHPRQCKSRHRYFVGKIDALL